MGGASVVQEQTEKGKNLTVPHITLLTTTEGFKGKEYVWSPLVEIRCHCNLKGVELL